MADAGDDNVAPHAEAHAGGAWRILSEAVEHLGQGFTVFDAELRLVHWNRKAIALLDLPPHLFKPGMPLAEFFRHNAERGEYGPGDVDEQVASRVALARKFEPHLFERARPNGTVMEVRGSPLPGGGFITAYTDVTDRHRMEREARAAQDASIAAENLLRDAIDAISEGFVLYGRDGRLVMRNERTKDFFPAIADKFEPGMPFTELLDAAVERGQYTGAPDEIVAWKAARLEEFHNPSGVPFLTHLSDGRWIQTTDRLTRDGGVVGIRTDVTALKRAEEELASTAAILEATLANVDQGIAMFDANHRLLTWNRRYAELRGIPEELLVRGTTFEAIARGQAERGAYASMKDVMGDDVESQVRYWVNWIKSLSARAVEEQVRADGSVHEVRINPLDGGGVVMTITDITERKRADQALRDNERRFRQMLESSPVGVIVNGRGNRVIFRNRRWSELAHVAHDDQPVDADHVYLRPEDKQRLKDLLKENGLVRDVEMEFRRLDGEPIWALISMQRMTLADEPVTISWVTDISERKRIEDALRESEARFVSMLKDSPLGVAVVRSSDRRIIYANARMYEMFRIGEEELNARRPADYYVDPKDREMMAERMKKDGSVRDAEVRLKRGDGTEMWVSASYMPIEYVGEAARLAWFYDITERKHAEEKVRVAEERHLLAMRAAAETSFTWDMVKDEIFLFAREGGFFGLDPDSVRRAADWRRRVHADDLAILDGAIIAHAKGLTERLESEYRVMDGQGKWRQVREHALAQRDANGQATWLAGAIIDITDEIEAKEILRAAKQAAEEASASKSEFLANMSHELRTPLNAIIGYSEIMLEEAEEKGERENVGDLRKIQSAGKHLLALINNILDLSKIEAGKIDIYLETFDVADAVNDLATTISVLAEQNANTFRVRVGRDLGTMHSDLTKIRQTLFNLLSNACKFTKNGSVTLKVSRLKSAAGDYLKFAVTDTGIGMTKEECQRVFEAFTQADSSTSRHFGGSGLGLAITRSFCQMLGGDITVTSEKGKGSTFVMRLPAMAPSAVEEGAEAGTDADTAHLPPQALSVLIVDDDPKVRDLLSRYLRRHGYRAITAAGGEQALTLAAQAQPDAITLDVLMPGMDGWAVLTALKDRDSTAHIPVIMLTIVDDRNIGFSLGAADYLIKPVDRSKLLATLAKHCPRRRHGRVLMVEDDASTREIMKSILKKEKWVVVEAENGAAGLERIDDADPDVILLDLMMPVMDGFEFLSEIRQRERWHGVPVIVVTAKTLTAADRRRLDGRVQMLLRKDVQSIDALPRILGDVIPPARRQSGDGQRR